MADDHAPPPSSPSASTTAQANFFRRPSFFRGAKTKTHKQTPSSTLYPPSLNLTSTTTPELDTPPLPTPDTYPFPARDSTTPQRRTRQASRHSIASSVTDLGASLRRSRSASLRTNTSDGSTARTSSSHKRVPSANTLALASSPEKTGVVNSTATGNAARPALSISTFSRGNKQKSSESVKSTTEYGYVKSPLSAAAAADKHKTTTNMAVPMPLRHAPTQKEILQANQQSNRTLAPAAPIPVPNGANPNLVFQHIHELASKRISTLDYLRKAHEGRIYWFNTLLFSKTDLTRLPSFSSRNQARRATQYLLLGFSLPTILDLNANSPADYLKALNALLVEFEQYQAVHPADGSTPSTLSRARLPQMFKRANMGMGMGMGMSMGGKGRRSSSATTGEIPVLTASNSFSGSDAGSINGAGTGGPTGSLSSMMTTDAFSPPANTDDSLHPNESYTHLQTPSLPFDPDFFSTFATLCDVLIDCYSRILGMLATPESVVVAGGGQPSLVGDLFSKADARVRKILLAGVVREFEDSCRAGVKGEVGGVGKVVLGGLM